MLNILVVLVSFIVPIICFLDSGSIYSNNPLPSHYIIDSDSLIKNLEQNCQAHDKLTIYRFKGGETLDLNFIKHVQYDLIDKLDSFKGLCGYETIVVDVDNLQEIDIDTKGMVLVQQIPPFQKRDVYDELEEDLKAAASMAAEEDLPVNILQGDTEETGPVGGSLFEKYQFFSPGLFMCLIVSFLLLFILVNALSWIGGIDITYQSFEKQVDLDKKNE